MPMVVSKPVLIEELCSVELDMQVDNYERESNFRRAAEVAPLHVSGGRGTVETLAADKSNVQL